MEKHSKARAWPPPQGHSLPNSPCFRRDITQVKGLRDKHGGVVGWGGGQVVDETLVSERNRRKRERESKGESPLIFSAKSKKG